MKSAESIDVGALVGPNALTPEDGQKVYAVLLENLRAKRVIDLDFSKVQVFASPFFNASISRLLLDFSAEFLREHLRLLGLTGAGDRVLRKSLENARAFYGSDEDGKNAIRTAIRDATS